MNAKKVEQTEVSNRRKSLRSSAANLELKHLNLKKSNGEASGQELLNAASSSNNNAVTSANISELNAKFNQAAVRCGGF